MQKEKDPAEPRPPVVEPTREVGLHRCPFCHEAVAVDDGRWVGCASCLARHHAACWDEGRACGACRHTQRLVPERVGPGRPQDTVSLTRVLVTLGLLGAIALPVFVLAQRNQQERREAQDRARRAADERVTPERARAREEAAVTVPPARAEAAFTLELVVRGLPAEGVVYALSPRGGHDGRRARVTGSLAGGRALVPGYSSAGQVALTLEWDRDGVHYLRYWPLEATSDRLELDVPSAADDATVRGRVAPGLKSVMAFGAVLSARCDVAPDGGFVLAGLPPGEYSLVGYADGHSPHSGYKGAQVELGPKADVTLDVEVPAATPMR